MGLLTFKGGVHPNDGKSLAKDKAIVELLPQGDLVYPLSQHIGAPAKPVVAKGDHVLKGQKIAEAGGFVSAPIYASVSGTVKAIEPRVNPTGSKVNSIIIANDGQYEEVEYPQPKPLSELTKEEILNIIGSDLPVDSPSSHVILAGHTGLPSAKLLTDLNKMEIGDKFEISVLKYKFVYEVDQILVVEPNNTENLGIEEGKQFATLITCTPYGVNSH